MVLVCKVKLSGAVQRQSESRVQTSLPQAEGSAGWLPRRDPLRCPCSFLPSRLATKPDYEIVQRLV